MKLADLQKLFEENARGLSDELSSYIEPAGTLSAKDAVHVYRNGHTVRLTEALGEIYEGCWRLLGDEEFFKAAEAYITKYPSQSYNLADYGEHFAEFLADRFPGQPVASELAQFERKFAQLFHAKEETGYTAEEIATMDESCRMQFVSSMFIQEGSGAFYSIWQARANPDPPEINFDSPEMVVCCRSGTEILIQSISRAQCSILRSLMAGKTLAESLNLSNATAEEVKEIFSYLAANKLILKLERG